MTQANLDAEVCSIGTTYMLGCVCVTLYSMTRSSRLRVSGLASSKSRARGSSFEAKASRRKQNKLLHVQERKKHHRMYLQRARISSAGVRRSPRVGTPPPPRALRCASISPRRRAATGYGRCLRHLPKSNHIKLELYAHHRVPRLIHPIRLRSHTATSRYVLRPP